MLRQLLLSLVIAATLLCTVTHAELSRQEAAAAPPDQPRCFTTPCPPAERNYTILANFKDCKLRSPMPRIELFNETSGEYDRTAAPFAFKTLEKQVVQFSVPSSLRGRILLTDGDLPTSVPVNLLLVARAYLGGEATHAAGLPPTFEPRRHTARIAYLPPSAGLGLATPHVVSSVKFADTRPGKQLKAGSRQTLYSSSDADKLVFVTWCAL